MVKKLAKSIFIALFISLFFLSNSVYAYEQKSVTLKLDNGKNKSVQYFSFKPNEDLALLPVLAQDKVGKHEELSNMAIRQNAIAAINGTFFNAYDENDLMPQGTLMVNRELHHTGGSITMGISSQNELIFTQEQNYQIYIVDQNERQYGVWSINRFHSSSQAVMIFDSYYKDSLLTFPDTTFFTVSNNKVTSIELEKATVPSNGFVIALGSNVNFSFELNEPLYYEINYVNEQRSALHMISNGPKLVSIGKYDIDFERDGMKDPKMTQLSAQRSFIGNRDDGTIVMGTVSNVTLPELAEILLQMGLYEAINLDGGASSGLYYNNKYITKPGRKLSNALVVVHKARAPRIEINGEEVFLKDASAYTDSGTTMIPVRGVLEKLGAVVDWDQANQQVITQFMDTKVVIPLNQKIVKVNGFSKEISIPAQSKNGRTYIPLRFLVEAFGFDIHWNQERYTVEINTHEDKQ